ncbi:plasma membrane fusion protein PRM1 [Cryptococcus deuterogattii R265]|uniref:plasma membrane fusion protein PRM1 n=1 Tax=Cryptococcus deuterogattii (strain R265) TaxID=294750 RepID=UPI001936806D|nr:plasma membrane fusion protein PRM1 [Cryptococcus deuterogattii R265]
MSYPQPPPKFVNSDEIIPLSPPARTPFAQYVASPLPATPHTAYSPPSSSQQSATTPLRPYLTLLPRIMLTFFSPCLLPMILTIFHLIQNRSSTASLATSLKSSVLSTCSGLAKGAASIKTLPRYLAMQTNQEAIRATQASILAIGTMLMDAITIIEVVVNFIVDTYRSMLLCTIELAVRGTLEILISAVQAISHSITDTLNSVRSNIQDDINDANNIIQAAVSAINKVTTLVSLNVSVPEFSIPALSFLENVTIPTAFEDSLITLNSSLPTMNDLKEKMDQIIDTPFEALISEINSTRLEMAASFNSSILPVPSLSSLSASSADDLSKELCSDLDTSLIDDTAKALHRISSIAIDLMFLLLFLVWATLAIWEWRRERVMRGEWWLLLSTQCWKDIPGLSWGR